MSSSSYVIVGHAVIPLFLDARSKNPVIDPITKEFHLHSGNFQVPIFATWPSNLKPMTYERFVEQDKIPCSTMLVRIRKARKSPTGDLLSISDYPDHNRAT